MRASMAACTVPARDVGGFRATDVATALAGQHTALHQLAHDLLGEKRVPGGPFGDGHRHSPTEGSEPSSSPSSAAVFESPSGPSAIVCAPGTRVSAPSYSGREVISTIDGSAG